MEGIVKWFNNQKGWGFIVPENGEEDVFVHYSEIKGDGFKTLKAGQRVTYELEHGNKGLYARDVNAAGGELVLTGADVVLSAGNDAHLASVELN